MESEEHRSKAQSCRGDLFAKGRLKQPVIFRRNIITRFEGPKDSKFDSEDVKFRKESTRKRSELIRGLSPECVEDMHNIACACFDVREVFAPNCGGEMLDNTIFKITSCLAKKVGYI
jgi:hypothetical protein